MKITKKFLSVLTAAFCAASACVCNVSADAENIVGNGTEGVITYEIVDIDFDSNGDFARITDIDVTAENVTVPRALNNYAVQEIESDVFTECTSLANIYVDPENKYFKHVDGVLFSKDGSTLVCYPRAKATSNKYDVPKDVVTINDNAFANCEKMENITLGNNVTTIGTGAFEGCTKLADIVIPENVSYVGRNAFANTEIYNYQSRNKEEGSSIIYYADKWVIGCDDMKTIKDSATPIKAGTTGIAGGAFIGATSLVTVDIPDSVLYIGDSAFSGCDQLSAVTFSKSLKTIEANAFYNCDSLAIVKLPSTLGAIKEGAFQSCDRLTEINIPASVTTIEAYTFEGCALLSEIDIPKTITEIKTCAFQNCEALTKVTINNNACVIADKPTTIANTSDKFDGTIIGYKASTAEEYTKSYNIRFEELNGSSNVDPVPGELEKGDANKDGKVNVRDAAAIASALAKNDISSLPSVADYNGDGKINVRDAAAIASFLASSK